MLFRSVSQSRYPPPRGSGIMPSISLCSFMSFAVNFRASAAFSLYSQLLHKIELQLSGDTAQTFILNRALVPQDNVEASQRLSIVLDPTTSMGGTMELPFIYERNALSIPNTEWNVMGKVSIRLLNPLKHANGAVDTVQVSVFAWAEDVELAVPTCVEPGSITPQAGEYTPQADEYETPTKEDAPVVSGALSQISNIA